MDVDYEAKSLKEILASPVSSLQGLSEKVGALLAELNVNTVKDLAEFKFCQRAEAIVTMAEFEQTKTDVELKAERMLKKLE